MTLLLDLFRHGGFIMYPLLILSLALWIIILHRFSVLKRVARDPYGLAVAVVDARDRDCDLQSVAAITTPTDRFSAALRTWLDADGGTGVPAFIASVREAVIPSKTLLQPLIQAAPLLGLLGTVTGMVQTFTVLAEMGSASPTALSSGIAQALITTQAGLSIALAALFGATLVERKEKEALHAIERAGLVLTQLEDPRS